MKSRAFTLVELLVTIAIISLLMAMAMPMLNVAREQARASMTRSVMARVDGALRQFKTDYRVYPYQLSYADVDNGEQPDNRLAYHLGTDISDAQRTRVIQDMDAAAAQSSCRFDVYTQDVSSYGAIAYTKADLVNAGGHYLSGAAGALVLLNRMGAERLRLSVLAGCTTITGPRITQYSGGIRDLSGIRALPNPASRSSPDIANGHAGPGWAVDYLAGELEQRFIKDQAVLDAWKRPIAYVCQVLPTCRPTATYSFYAASLLSDITPYGLNTPSRVVLTEGLAADAAGLPDPANLRHSDRRRYAAAGYENEFELWSSGRDGRLGWMRDDARNRDNVPLVPYDAELR